ncbi:hypothetical protein K5D34_10710 [Pseudomonas cichorii]|uniref:Methyl-accepting chemotaxis protein n=1 Tax=Pseudomonas lijiangensis TaxID=2995658 RepID=A0ABX8HUY2_9PSED|nr:MULTISPECIES: hypothetical protein [Pseudomonas syringae group]MBX8501048.1 hypothetical protein [Pseudomonas lijiangensis]MBX8505882.1 hypothetical protein [Pseudomonas lijiangensis]MBX8510148.1 hypothetical protein [Pseudomonas cichorii]MBX8520730.1 hypothetical protein [Pseudomonas cichorii]MBX8525229.1 hypothetical protein [Pseudomonas cichorii]
MNSQHIAHLRISSLHIQQGLFLLLALLVTLIAVQQFQSWDQSREAAQTQQKIIKISTSHQSLTRTAQINGLGPQPVDGLVSANEVVTPQKWIF